MFAVLELRTRTRSTETTCREIHQAIHDNDRFRSVDRIADYTNYIFRYHHICYDLARYRYAGDHVSSTNLKHFGFLLKDLSQRYVQRFEQHASEISLTLMQCKVLVHLEKNEGVSQARLAELTGIEPMMMVRILDRMEADRLLERRADPADRRARQLYLTKKAEPLLSEVWRLAELTRNEMFAGIGKTERDSFMHTLERMHLNACALAAPSTAGATPVPARRARSPRTATTK